MRGEKDYQKRENQKMSCVKHGKLLLMWKTDVVFLPLYSNLMFSMCKCGW